MSEPPPSQLQDKFIIRLPDGMRDRIRAAAVRNNRSMNAEVVATLEEKYPPPQIDEEEYRFFKEWVNRSPEEERGRIIDFVTRLLIKDVGDYEDAMKIWEKLGKS
jgi:hypothetical protein